MADKVTKLEKDLKEAKKALENSSVFMRRRARRKVEQLEKKLVEAKILLANKGKPLTSAQEEYVKNFGKPTGKTPSGQMKRKTPSNKAPKLPPTKDVKDVRGTKSVPTPPKTPSKTPPKTPPKPKSRPAAKKPAAKNSVTTTGGRPVTLGNGRPVTLGKSSEEAGGVGDDAFKAFFKKHFGIDVKPVDDDYFKRSSPERAKGGMVAKKKPVVAKKYGGMAVKKKAGGTVKKMCGGMAHRSKKGKK